MSGCVAWGAPHTQYRISYIEQVVHWKQHMGFNLLLTGKVMLAAVAFGLARYLFGELMHLIKDILKKVFKNAYVIVIVGGLIVIGIVFGLRNAVFVWLPTDIHHNSNAVRTSRSGRHKK